MKRNIIISVSFLFIILIFACENSEDPAGLRGIGIVPVVDDVNPGIFDSKNLKDSYVEFTVKLGEGDKAEKAVIVGSYRDNREQTVIAETSTFPAKIRIVSGDVIQKLGLSESEIVNGDVFTFEVLLTANGLTTRSPAVLRVVVSCAYNNSLTYGSYHAKSSDWNSEGDIIITPDPVDHYKVYVRGLEEMEGLVEDKGPLVMSINPATYEVTVPAHALSSDAWGYGSITYSGTGAYNSCDGSYVMHFEISLEALGSQGIYTFTFGRNVN